MNESSTLPQALCRQSTGHGGITFLERNGLERSLSYGELQLRALHVLQYLRGAGVAPGDEVIIHIADNLGFVDALWACLLGGLVPVPLSTGNASEHRRKLVTVMGLLRRPFLFTERKLLRRLHAYSEQQGSKPVIDRAPVLLLEDVGAGGRNGTPHDSTPDDVALIQFSSGSTGDAKGVVLTHRQLLSNIQAICLGAELSTEDATLSWMPLTHDMGLIGFHLLPLVLGLRQYLMPTEAFTRRPLGWLTHASEKRVTVLSSPNFGLAHMIRSMRDSAVPMLDLSRVRLIFNGAELISGRLCREFCLAFATHGLRSRAMFPVYGLAEATLAVTFPSPGDELMQIQVERAALGVGQALKIQPEETGSTVPLVGVGKPLTGVTLRLVDELGAPLAEGRVGHVQICGDGVTCGYYGHAGFLRDGFTDDGWLKSGDLGALVDGVLYIVGRADDRIIINGQNYHAHDLEWICQHLAGLEPGTVACAALRQDHDSTDGLGVFVQHRKSLEGFLPVASRVRDAVREATGLECGAVIPIQSLPRTSSGKVRRHSLRDGFIRGDHGAIIAALQAASREHALAGRVAASAMEIRLKGMMDSIRGDGGIGIHDNLIDCGADSLALTTLLLTLEQQFPAAVKIEDFLEYPTIAALAEFLERSGCAADRQTARVANQ